MRDVARRSGVSVATVSNVLHQTAPVAEDTRRRVLEAIEELGYRQNEVARSLKRRATQARSAWSSPTRSTRFTPPSRSRSSGAPTATASPCSSPRPRTIPRTRPTRCARWSAAAWTASSFRPSPPARPSPPSCSTGACRWCRCRSRAATRGWARSGRRGGGDGRAGRPPGRARPPPHRLRPLGRARGVGGRAAGGDAALRSTAAAWSRSPTRRAATAVCCTNDVIAIALMDELERQGLRVPATFRWSDSTTFRSPPTAASASPPCASPPARWAGWRRRWCWPRSRPATTWPTA